MEDVKKNFQVSSAVAAFFDEMTERLANQKSHGLVFTACMLKFAALDEAEQRHILSVAYGYKFGGISLEEAISQTAGNPPLRLAARKAPKK